MSHDEVLAMMEEIGVPYSYDHFAEGESPEPPFICFLYPDNEEFAADNVVFHSNKNFDIELYTDRKDPALEDRVEEILTAHELFFHKSEVWIEDEKLYEVLYETTV